MKPWNPRGFPTSENHHENALFNSQLGICNRRLRPGGSHQTHLRAPGDQGPTGRQRRIDGGDDRHLRELHEVVFVVGGVAVGADGRDAVDPDARTGFGTTSRFASYKRDRA